MNQIPDRIFLQIHGDVEVEDANDVADVDEGNVTWSSERIYDNDVEYIRNNSPRIGQKSGKDYINSLPLAERLTDKERELIRKEYESTYHNDIDQGVANMRVANVLVSIFGKEMFK